MFLIGAAGGTYYLYQKPIATASIGTGMYITAGLLALTPIFLYLPVFLGAEEGTAEGAGTAIGSILGLIIWGFVFFLIALVIFGLGYFINKRARKKVGDATATQLPVTLVIVFTRFPESSPRQR